MLRRTALMFLSALAFAGDSGLPARPKPSDYPVNQETPAATLAAAIVPVVQVHKMFSNDIARNYFVVEVAIYPADGHSFDVDRFDFALKSGDNVTHAENPRNVAEGWAERKNPLGNRGPSVTTETGVVYERTHDPVNGTRSGVGTYTGVAVSDRNPGAPDPPPSPKKVDAHLDDRLRDQALPQGQTRNAVAGYLYFPRFSKTHKGDAIELEYSKDDASANLRFPAK